MVTPAAVSARAGLARTSVYNYFSSSADIFAQLAQDAFVHWGERLRECIDALPTPDDKIDAYVRTTLELAASGEHRIGAVLAGLDLPESCQRQLDELHSGLLDPLREALRARGDPEPETTAMLVQGTLDGAVRLIDAGWPPGPVASRTLAFLLDGLRPAGVASTGDPHGGMEFATEDAYRAWLASDAFRAAHPGDPAGESAVRASEVHTYTVRSAYDAPTAAGGAG